MQVLERPLRKCPTCGKDGYLYTRFQDGHNYLYTVHKNEPPIGISATGEPKYRACYDNGRLYESIEDAVKADKQKKKRKIICPKCGKKGRLCKFPNRANKEIRYMFTHEHIGIFKKSKIDKYRRCYLNKEQIEQIGKKPEIKKPVIEIIGKKTQCPKCGKEGTLNIANKKKETLLVRHEALDGYWGNKKKIKKLRRCYLSKEQAEKCRQNIR